MPPALLAQYTKVSQLIVECNPIFDNVVCPTRQGRHVIHTLPPVFVGGEDALVVGSEDDQWWTTRMTGGGARMVVVLTMMT